MKSQAIFKNQVFRGNLYHVCVFLKTEESKMKITYTSDNAYEKCNVEIFDGEKLNHLLSIYDLGIAPENGSYVWDNERRSDRAKSIIKMAIKYIETIL